MVTLSLYHGYQVVTMYASIVWVKFIYYAGDTSSCDMVATVLRDVFSHLFLRLTAAHSFSNLFFSSIVIFFDPLLQESHGFDPCDLVKETSKPCVKCSSEVLSVIKTSTKALFEAFSIGIDFTNDFIITVFSLVFKCWCGTNAARFSQFAQRHSDMLSPWMHLPGDNNCMLSVPSSACDLINVGKVVKFAKLEGLRRTDAFRKNADLPSVQFCCLCHPLLARHSVFH